MVSVPSLEVNSVQAIVELSKYLHEPVLVFIEDKILTSTLLI